MSDELLPCPFCDGEAERIDIEEEGPNFGGSCIECKKCMASSPVHFDRKENLEDSWNQRSSNVLTAAHRERDALVNTMRGKDETIQFHDTERMRLTEERDTALAHVVVMKGALMAITAMPNTGDVGNIRDCARQALSTIGPQAELLLKRIASAEEVIRPFAEYGKGAPKAFPDSAFITEGSPLARPQLMMRDVRRASSWMGDGKKDL